MIDKSQHQPARRDDAPTTEVPVDDSVIGRMFKRSVLVILAVVILGGLGYVLFSKKDEKPIDKVTDTRPPDVRQIKVELPSVPFSDVTSSAGITFVHENGATGEKLLPESMGGGCAILDYNNDGRPDLLFVNSQRWDGTASASGKQPVLTLYRNEGDWKFTDVSEEAGLAVSLYGQGVAVGDYDNDGWADLFVSAVGPNRLFHNEQGKFVDVTATAGVAGNDSEWSTSCGFFDYDRDGDLDLFVANYVRWSADIDKGLRCTLDGSLRAYCRPGAFDGTFPYLYRNDGNGKFTDVSEESGIQVRNPNTKVPMAKSLGVVFVDADGDDQLDIVVANDTVQNFLYHNQGNGKFAEVGLDRGIGVDNTGNARGAMGCDAGWFRNDDVLAVVIGNFSNEMTALYCTKKNAMMFSDDAVATGIGPPSRVWLKFGVCFVDIDLDSRLDLVVANGHLENDISKVQKSQQYQQPPQLYWNTGSRKGSEFARLESAQTGSEFAAPMVGRGAAYADFDADGDLDLVMTATGEAPRLLRNDQALKRHWLRLQLVGNGKTVSRDAVGAVVSITTEAGVQKRLVSSTRSYLAQVEKTVTFGLGGATKVEEASIRWPDGTTQSIEIDEVDRMLTIEQK